MGLQIIVNTHSPAEITKPHKVGLKYAVLEAGVCFGVLNGMKGQIILRKTVILYFVSGFRYANTQKRADVGTK